MRASNLAQPRRINPSPDPASGSRFHGIAWADYPGFLQARGISFLVGASQQPPTYAAP